MGARPITALALVCHPLKALGIEPLKAMLAGGLEALTEAGCALLGGHSVEDPEPKLGYAVTGLVDPEQAWRNNTLKPDGRLILTKPIGTGLVNMALRAQCASPEAQAAAEGAMATLNKAAAEVLARFQVQACTDVTGFGLAGHAAEMAGGTVCGLVIRMSQVPLLPDVQEYAAMGLIPEGTYRNREGRLRCLAGDLSASNLDLLFDPQTSGGLLVALPEAETEAALGALQAAGVRAWVIGETGGVPGQVRIL
jgi:selenide,water dikinase